MVWHAGSGGADLNVVNQFRDVRVPYLSTVIWKCIVPIVARIERGQDMDDESGLALVGRDRSQLRPGPGTPSALGGGDDGIVPR